MKDGVHGTNFSDLRLRRVAAPVGAPAADTIFAIGQIFDSRISDIIIDAGDHSSAATMFTIGENSVDVDIDNISNFGTGECNNLISFSPSARSVKIRGGTLDLPVTGGAVLFDGVDNEVVGVKFPQGGEINLRGGQYCALDRCNFGVTSTVSATAGTTTGQIGNRVMGNNGVDFPRNPAGEVALAKNTIYGNQNAKSQAVQALFLATYDQEAITTTTANAPVKTVTYPADTLLRFDTIRLFASGTFVSAGDKALRYIFGGIEILSYTDTSGDAKAWELRAETVIGTTTRCTTTYTLLADGAVVAQGNVRNTSLDLTEANVSELQAWVSAGTINLRTFRHDLVRQFMASTIYQG
jgi:hypothetical protein